jgi:hypothetical protein
VDTEHRRNAMGKRHLTKVHFFRGNKNRKGQLIYTESVAGKKQFRLVQDPQITFYADKEGVARDERQMYVPADDVERFKVPYHELPEHLAALTGNERWFQEARSRNEWQAKKLLHQDPCLHQSDTDIEDHYIGLYLDHYEGAGELDQKPKLHKAYWDIETDIYELGRFPEPDQAEAPVDAISLYSDERNTMLTFLLRNPENPQIAEFEARVEQMEKKSMDRFSLDNCRIFFFDDEMDLHTAFFDAVNEDFRPDFMGCWNGGFDFKYEMNRIAKLSGRDPAYTMCPREFPLKEVRYWTDEISNDPSTKGDYMICAGYSNYVDQMLTFAALRATMGKRGSYALDSIAEEELEDRKDPVPVPMREFSRWDYEKYVFN